MNRMPWFVRHDQAALRFHDVPFSSAIAAEAASRIEGPRNV